MSKIGDWIWTKDEYGTERIGLVIGFEPGKKVRICIFPENSGGQIRIVYDEWGLGRPVELSDLELEEEDKNMPRIQTQAWNEGFDLAQALVSLFGKPSSDFASLLVLGQAFAKMSGYGALNDGMKFIEGFSAGFSQPSPKEIESGQ